MDVKQLDARARLDDGSDTEEPGKQNAEQTFVLVEDQRFQIALH